MIYRKYLLLSVVITWGFTGLAQNNMRELGLGIGDQFSLNFLYKQQTAEKRYVSYDLVLARVGISSNSDITSASIAAGIGVTFEKRKDITEKVQFIHGWSPSFQVDINNLSTDSDDSSVSFISPGLGYRLGFLYHISENFYTAVQGQVSTNVTFIVSEPLEGTPTQIEAGFSPAFVTLAVVYRFPKKS